MFSDRSAAVGWRASSPPPSHFAPRFSTLRRRKTIDQSFRLRPCLLPRTAGFPNTWTKSQVLLISALHPPPPPALRCADAPKLNVHTRSLAPRDEWAKWVLSCIAEHWSVAAQAVELARALEKLEDKLDTGLGGEGAFWRAFSLFSPSAAPSDFASHARADTLCRVRRLRAVLLSCVFNPQAKGQGPREGRQRRRGQGRERVCKRERQGQRQGQGR